MLLPLLVSGYRYGTYVELVSGYRYGTYVHTFIEYIGIIPPQEMKISREKNKRIERKKRAVEEESRSEE